MALSQVVTTGDGFTSTFIVSFALGYISKDDVTCWVEGEYDGFGAKTYRALTWISTNMVTVAGDAPGSGVKVYFDRTVPRTELLVDYEDDDIINEENMNTSQKQSLMLVHEVLDGRFSSAFIQDLDMGGNKIINLGDPTDGKDAANKDYVDGEVANAIVHNTLEGALPVITSSGGLAGIDVGTLPSIFSVYVRGNLIGKDAIWQWDASSTRDPNPYSVIRPTSHAPSDPGRWIMRGEQISGGRVCAKTFGVVPCFDGANPLYMDDAHDALLAFADSIGASGIDYDPGPHLFKRALRYDRGLHIAGAPHMENHRMLVSGSTYAQNESAPTVTTFVACGNGTRNRKIKEVSNQVSMGYVHDNQNRLFTNAVDEKFELTDYTNKDAAGATPATSKLMSWFISFTEDNRQIGMENIRVMPSCPDRANGEIDGIGGYSVYSITPYADWDYGIAVTQAWMMELFRVSVVGPWKMGAHLNFNGVEDQTVPAPVGTFNCEHASYSHCQFQSGVHMRNSDMYPIVDKTSSVVYIQWTPSHQFNPAGGSHRYSTSDTYGGTVFTYTSATWHAATPSGVTDLLGGGFLAIRDFTPSGAGAPDTSLVRTRVTHPGACSKITAFFSGGHSHTAFYHCAMTDFSHWSGVDEAHVDYGPIAPIGAEQYGQPGRTKYSAAMEISGGPMRALKFSNCLLSVVGPVCMHIGAARDMTFEMDCYAEGRPYRNNPGDSLNGTRGAVIFAGSNVALSGDSGGAGQFWGRMFGYGFNPAIGMHPVKTPDVGDRMANQLNSFNAAGWVDFGQMFPRSVDLIIQGQPEQIIRLTRTIGGAASLQLYCSTVTGIERMRLLETWSITKAANLLPMVDNTYDVGSASFRPATVWSHMFNSLSGYNVNGTVVITADRHFVNRVYTLATLPTVGVGGTQIGVSDGVSNKPLLVSRGGIWVYTDGVAA